MNYKLSSFAVNSEESFASQNNNCSRVNPLNLGTISNPKWMHFTIGLLNNLNSVVGLSIQRICDGFNVGHNLMLIQWILNNNLFVLWNRRMDVVIRNVDVVVVIKWNILLIELSILYNFAVSHRAIILSSSFG